VLEDQDGTSFSVTSGTSYTITVGAGGAARSTSGR